MENNSGKMQIDLVFALELIAKGIRGGSLEAALNLLEDLIKECPVVGKKYSDKIEGLQTQLKKAGEQNWCTICGDTLNNYKGTDGPST